MRQSGFTLAELLIALSILGVIAVFTVPKVLQSQQDSKRLSILKESIATVSEILYEGWTEKKINASSNGLYILDHLNAVKVCRTDATAQGCWDPSVSDPSGATSEATRPGAILHNGAVVAGLDDYNDPDYNSFVMDWNGSLPPNVEGDDQIRLRMCYGSPAVCGLPAGTIKGHPGSGTSIAFYKQIFNP